MPVGSGFAACRIRRGRFHNSRRLNLGARASRPTARPGRRARCNHISTMNECAGRRSVFFRRRTPDSTEPRRSPFGSSGIPPHTCRAVASDIDRESCPLQTQCGAIALSRAASGTIVAGRTRLATHGSGLGTIGYPAALTEVQNSCCCSRGRAGTAANKGKTNGQRAPRRKRKEAGRASR